MDRKILRKIWAEEQEDSTPDMEILFDKVETKLRESIC